MATHAQGKRLIVQPRVVESGPVPGPLGSPGPTRATRHGGSTLGTPRAVESGPVPALLGSSGPTELQDMEEACWGQAELCACGKGFLLYTYLAPPLGAGNRSWLH